MGRNLPSDIGTVELPSQLLTVCSAGESRKALLKELYNAIEPLYHSQVRVEGVTPKSESKFVKRRITTAIRWYSIQEKFGWAMVVLGDIMPADWFEWTRFSDANWENLLAELAPFGDVMAGQAMHLLEKMMGEDAPIRLLQKFPAQDFGNRYDAYISKQTLWSRGGSLKSVAWMAGRIAQRWCAGSTSPVPYLFQKLISTTASVPWPKAGGIAMMTLEPFAWDVLPPGCDPLCVSPLDHIISMLIPGLKFYTALQSHCRGCNQDIGYGGIAEHFGVLAETAAEAQNALDPLLAISQSN